MLEDFGTDKLVYKDLLVKVDEPTENTVDIPDTEKAIKESFAQQIDRYNKTAIKIGCKEIKYDYIVIERQGYDVLCKAYKKTWA